MFLCFHVDELQMQEVKAPLTSGQPHARSQHAHKEKLSGNTRNYSVLVPQHPLTFSPMLLRTCCVVTRRKILQSDSWPFAVHLWRHKLFVSMNCWFMVKMPSYERPLVRSCRLVVACQSAESLAVARVKSAKPGIWGPIESRFYGKFLLLSVAKLWWVTQVVHILSKNFPNT